MASENKKQNYGQNLEEMAKKLGVEPVAPKEIEPLDQKPTSQLNQILTGWGNRIKDSLDVLDPRVKALSEKRLQICNVCPIRLGNKCDPRQEIQHLVTGNTVRGCGCNIAAKTMSPSSHCPAGKW